MRKLVSRLTVCVRFESLAAATTAAQAPKAKRINRAILFLNSMNPMNVVDMIKEGVMIGQASQQTAEIGRKYTNRQMPW